MLTAGPRVASGRHRTLEATVDWSYQLLTEPERWLLRRLSVFAGGFTLAGAEAVAGDGDPFETLSSLVDKSLVVWDPDAGRYRLLETIRTFAESRLKEEEEQTVAATAHLAWCTAFAETVREAAGGTEEARAYELVEREIDNLRAALAFTAGCHLPEGLRLVVQLRQYWYQRAPAEGGRWCRRLVEAVPDADPLEVGRLLSTAAFCASEVGRYDLAADDADRAIAVLAGAGDERALLQARLMRATLRTEQPRELEACRREHLDVAAAAVRLGDALTEAAALLNLAAKEVELGDPAAGLRHAEEGLRVLDGLECPPRARAVGLTNLGAAMLATGSPAPDALRVFVQALNLVEELRSPSFTAAILEGAAECLAESDPEGAARLLGAALGLRHVHGIGARPIEAAAAARIRETIEARIGAVTVSSLLESTGQVGVDEAVEIVRALTRDEGLEIRTRVGLRPPRALSRAGLRSRRGSAQEVTDVGGADSAARRSRRCRGRGTPSAPRTRGGRRARVTTTPRRAPHLHPPAAVEHRGGEVHHLARVGEDAAGAGGPHVLAGGVRRPDEHRSAEQHRLERLPAEEGRPPQVDGGEPVSHQPPEVDAGSAHRDRCDRRAVAHDKLVPVDLGDADRAEAGVQVVVPDPAGRRHCALRVGADDHEVVAEVACADKAVGGRRPVDVEGESEVVDHRRRARVGGARLRQAPVLGRGDGPHRVGGAQSGGVAVEAEAGVVAEERQHDQAWPGPEPQQLGGVDAVAPARTTTSGGTRRQHRPHRRPVRLEAPAGARRRPPAALPPARPARAPRAAPPGAAERRARHRGG